MKMADRKKDIHIELCPQGGLHVTSDLSLDAIRSIEGVGWAMPLHGSTISVDIDPRYDVKDVQADIEHLAKYDSNPYAHRSWGTIGKWTSVQDALPKGGLYVTVRRDTPANQPQYYVARYKFCPTGPNGARYEWVTTDHRVIDRVIAWSPVP